MTIDWRGAGRRGLVCSAAMIPAAIGGFILVAWLADDHLATTVVWTAMAAAVVLAAVFPAADRIASTAARIAGQPVSGLFASMYVFTIGLSYLVGGLLLDEGGAIAAGVIICTAAMLPFVLARIGHQAAVGIWLLYAIILGVASVVLLPAFGVGLVAMPPAVAAWLTYRSHVTPTAAVTGGGR